MGTPIALRYPNERVYETVLDRELRAGDRFDMYGRTWTAVATKQARNHRNRLRRVVCVPVEADGSKRAALNSNRQPSG